MVIAQIAVTHDELAAHWAVFLATKPQKAWVSKFICNLFDFCEDLSGFRWGFPENSEHLHSLDVHVDAALAELVKAATGGLGFEVNARANLA